MLIATVAPHAAALLLHFISHPRQANAALPSVFTLRILDSLSAILSLADWQFVRHLLQPAAR